MGLVDLLLLIAASVSLADVLSNEVIGIPVRELTGIRHNARKEAMEKPNNFFANLLWCEYCLMYWTAGLWTVLYAVYYPAFLYGTMVFGGAKLAHFVWERYSRFHR